MGIRGRPIGKVIRDGIIFSTGVAGFVFSVFIHYDHPNFIIMGFSSLWAGAPVFIPDTILSKFVPTPSTKEHDDRRASDKG